MVLMEPKDRVMVFCYFLFLFFLFLLSGDPEAAVWHLIVILSVLDFLSAGFLIPDDPSHPSSHLFPAAFSFPPSDFI